MPSIPVVCQSCDAKLTVSDDLAHLAMCPRCGNLIEAVAGKSALHNEVWFYQVLGEEVGPLSFHDLKRLARERKVSPETLVRMGTGRWVLAERVTGLAGCWTEGLEEWFFVREGKKLGPVSFQALKSLITSGNLAGKDFVQRADWDSAVSVQDCIAQELLPEPLAAVQEKVPDEKLAPPPDAQVVLASLAPTVFLPPPASAPPTEKSPASFVWPPAIFIYLAFLAGIVTALVAVGLAVLLLSR